VGSGPLALIEEWPVANVAAAVVTATAGDVTEAIGDIDRPYRLASVTKALVATAALVAVEEETLHLAHPAGPEGSTVRHLLAHASGLGLHGGVPAEPGRRRVYSNAGFEVLGSLLEQESGLGVASYLTEAVLGPLGMAATRLTGSPAHAAVSTATDLAKWAKELMAPRLLAADTVQQATTVAFADLDGVLPGFGWQSPCDWGLGFEIRGTKEPHWTAAANSPATFGHFGRSGTFVWVDPAAGRALVVLTDREFGDWAKLRWPALSAAVLAEP